MEVHVGARFDQRFDGGCIVLRGGIHQRRLFLPFFPGIHVCAMAGKHLHGIRIACAGHGHENGFALRRRRVRIRSGFYERFNQARVTIHGSQRQRSNTIAVRRSGIRTRTKQQLCGLGVVRAHRPVKRSHAVRFRGIHVGTLLQERVDALSVTSLDCLNEAQVTSSCAETDG